MVCKRTSPRVLRKQCILFHPRFGLLAPFRQYRRSGSTLFGRFAIVLKGVCGGTCSPTGAGAVLDSYRGPRAIGGCCLGFWLNLAVMASGKKRLSLNDRNSTCSVFHRRGVETVSYTHLTLPTICSV